MKKTIIFLLGSAVALSACDRGPSPEKQQCQTALAKVQPYVTYSVRSLVSAHASSQNSKVPLAFRGATVPTQIPNGALVVETNAPAGADRPIYFSSTVTNIYCK